MGESSEEEKFFVDDAVEEDREVQTASKVVVVEDEEKRKKPLDGKATFFVQYVVKIVTTRVDKPLRRRKGEIIFPGDVFKTRIGHEEKSENVVFPFFLYFFFFSYAIFPS